MPKARVTDDFKAPEGIYKVKFSGISSKDDEGEPAAKMTDFGMRVYGNLRIVEGQYQGEEIPVGMDLEDSLPAWCFLFSGKPPGSSSLADIEKQMKTDKEMYVRVNENGWAAGVSVPKGTYLAKFRQFLKRDENGKPIHVTKEYQGEQRERVYWQFEIVAGDLTGVWVPGTGRYAVKQEGDEIIIPGRSGMYQWLSAAGVDFENAPEFADGDNILPELEQIMQRAGVVLSIQVDENGWVTGQAAVSPAPSGVTTTAVSGGASVDPGNVKGGQSENGQASQEPSDQEQSPDDGLEGDALIEKLIKAVGKRAEECGYGYGETDGVLNDQGKAFAKEYIAPVCAQLGAPRSFAKMNDSQRRQLLGMVPSIGEPVSQEAESGGDF